MARLWHLIAIVLHVAQVNSEEEPDNDYIPDNDFEPVTLHRLIAPGEHVKREDHIQELFAPKSEAAWHYLNCKNPRSKQETPFDSISHGSCTATGHCQSSPSELSLGRSGASGAISHRSKIIVPGKRSARAPNSSNVAIQ